MTPEESLDAALEKLTGACARIDAQWRRTGYDVDQFPESVLAEHLDRPLELTGFGDLAKLRRLLDRPDIAALQRLSSFSDVYVKLFDNGRFWVEVLNWWGSDINIHDHDFAGIQFQLTGRSLNVQYRFDAAATEENVHFGAFSVSAVDTWEPGDWSFVRPGRVAPHNVCHIDIPTVSLLIRTHPYPRLGPQWNYFPPSLAASYGVADAVFRKNVKCLRLLARGGHDALARGIEDFSVGRPVNERLFAAVKMIDILFQKPNVPLLRLLLDDDERLLRGVAFFRAMEEIKHLKNANRFSFAENLALSALGTAFDAGSLEIVRDRLYGGSGKADFVDALAGIARSLPRDDALRLARVAALFEVDLLRQGLAA